ncbi:hypothetical protein [Stigmatella aurantiaca]|uniref:hypothetical protein n=1 Tax=Stigmatella aurantiaca TaxID=41 RepID=UPI000317A40A|nr:hypothetical protein [Stigmatella aurantiaca]
MAGSLAQLDANLAASTVTLSEEQAARLDAVSAVPLGFPHEMLAAEGLGLRIAGGKPELRKPPFAPAA